MKYDLRKLSDYQAMLDKKIALNHNVSLDETITRRILAFLVELGELANETRCFKYWSIKDASARDIILEEYVDGIHFLVSLTNQISSKLVFEVNKSTSNLSSLFIDVFNKATLLNERFSVDNLENLFNEYLVLGESLGFDNNDIISAYLEKNEENHKRQEENY